MTDVIPRIPTATNNALQQRMSSLILRALPQEGRQSSAIEAVELFRSDSSTDYSATVYDPSLCFVIQGSKTVQLGDREIVYEPLSYMASNVHLPVMGRITSASPEQPFLAVKLSVNPQEVADLVLELGGKAPPLDSDVRCTEMDCGLCTSTMDERMQGAVYRLLSLLATPEDIAVLAPLVRREIIYRALMGELGPRMRKFAVSDSQAHRISRVISTLKDRYTQPLRIPELALAANMSESTLYHSFKQVTRMSPLQFQKKLRLHEARRLMLAEGLEAATASYRVGYESPSHFSRDYSRMFGAPPRTDVVQFRGERGTRELA